MKFLSFSLVAATAAVLFTAVCAVPEPLPPLHVRDYGPNTDKYVVKNLPEVTFSLPKSWAGSLPIGGDYGTDSLFFWLWQAETKLPSNDLIIWFNGGPGCSSLTGLFKENGPLQFYGNSTCPQPNKYSYTKLANVLYIDQPAQVGFSTGDTPVLDITNTTESFVLFFDNFLKAFPALANMNMHFMGESYAGVYVPYILQTILEQNTKLKVKSISLGDATFQNGAADYVVPSTTYITETPNHYLTKLIPADILAALQQGDRECGFPGVLSQITYPPKGKIIIPGNPENANFRRDVPASAQTSSLFNVSACDFENGTRTPADVLYFIHNNTDDCYGPCATFDALYQYLYDNIPTGCWTPYNIDVGCVNTYRTNAAFQDYLNSAAVQAALHIPPGTDYSYCSDSVQADYNQDIVPPAYSILPSFITKGIKVNIYNGKLDFLIPHVGAELAIQNMTWAGAQGFQKKPASVFFGADGRKAGIWHEERGLSYHLFENAGHEVPMDDPAGAFSFVKGILQ